MKHTVQDLEQEILSLAIKNEHYLIELLCERADNPIFPNSMFNDVLDIAEGLIQEDRKATRGTLLVQTKNLPHLKDYIKSLKDYSIDSDWKYYKDKLLDHYRVERVKKIANKISELNNIDKIQGAFEEMENTLTQRKSIGLIHVSEIVDQVYNNLTKPEETREQYLQTGFPTIDEYVLGIALGSLIVIAARPSKGKSSLALSLLNRMSKMYDCVLFSIEMTNTEVTTNLLAGTTGQNLGRARAKGLTSKHSIDLLNSGKSELARRNIKVCDSADINIYRLHQIIKHEKMKNPNLKCIFVDYIGIMPYSSANQTEYQALSEITKTLKQIAIKYNIVIFALAQLNRKVEDTATKVPNLASLRGSGSIEQDANQVWFIHHPNEEEDKEENRLVIDTDIIIAKNRGGRTGTVGLAFDKGATKFYDKQD
jgi:replicative DNA helicase